MASVSAERVGQGEVGGAHTVCCAYVGKRAMEGTGWANSHPGCMHEQA